MRWSDERRLSVTTVRPGTFRTDLIRHYSHCIGARWLILNTWIKLWMDIFMPTQIMISLRFSNILDNIIVFVVPQNFRSVKKKNDVMCTSAYALSRSRKVHILCILLVKTLLNISNRFHVKFFFLLLYRFCLLTNEEFFYAYIYIYINIF